MKSCEVTYVVSLEQTLKVFGGKWKPIIIWILFKDGIKRYGEIKKELPGITHKMLSQQLKELEKDNIVNRKEYPQIPPKVEYSLTAKGKSFVPILVDICEWGFKNLDIPETSHSTVQRARKGSTDSSGGL
jgi:DNA-binding HxlR family transcriptional regulator